MRDRPVLDVADLPTVVFGSRAPLWWGVLGLMAIEGTMFAIMAASYFYLRGGASVWPPPGVVHPGLGLTTFNLAVLLASVLPMHFATKAIEREDIAGIRNWLLVAVVFGLTFLVGRGIVLSNLAFRWDSHAYGSLIWTTAGLHSLHALTGTLEDLLFIALIAKGPVEDKHLLDLRLNSLYWYFVVFSWVPFYCIFFLDPGLLGTR
jgi:cytochrome c oxidase subunit 3